MAKKKFDTNPLDPDFPAKAREAQQTAVLPNNDFQTAPFTAPPSVTEEQTRKFGEQSFNQYQAPYNGQNVPANFQATRLADMGNTSKRKVAKIGLPENIMTALPYLPFYIGLIAGILELVFVPKSETKVRFHAAQGLAAHIGILLVWAILESVGKIGFGLANVGSWIFQLVTFVMLIIFAIKAFQSKPVHIESVDDLTEWLEEKIQPKK
jgi:uncharacterized membrane protein